jgi:two-component system, chemotaxis family, chemotaxis protein CheY
MGRLKTQLDVGVMRALVVDDLPYNRSNLERNLKNMGFTHVDQAANVDEAMAKMEQTAYDIVFLDWNMPGRSGFHLLKSCREERSYDHVAFVMVSSESENRTIIEALKAGATAYIVKPVQDSALLDQMNKVLEWIERRR